MEKLFFSGISRYDGLETRMVHFTDDGLVETQTHYGYFQDQTEDNTRFFGEDEPFPCGSDAKEEIIRRFNSGRKRSLLAVFYRNLNNFVRSSKIRRSVIEENYMNDEYGSLSNFHMSDERAFIDFVNQIVRHSNGVAQSLKFGSNYIYLTSNKYKILDGGLCEDKDIKCVRVKRLEDDKIVKIKVGRLLNAELGELIKPKLLTYVSEIISQKWTSWTKGIFGTDLHLVVDDDFKYIYSSDNYFDGDFGSCMTDSGQHYFYSESISAKAASLRNDDGLVLARCIVYTEAIDNETGQVYRLAERQYSASGDTSLKQMLVNKLIEEGYIDGYKNIYAGCGEMKSFTLNDGTDLSNRILYIHNSLRRGDTLSYQDSFKAYDIDEGKAYNDYGVHYDYDLATTEDYIGRFYDEYLEEEVDCDEDDIVTAYHWRNGHLVEIRTQDENVRYLNRYNEYYTDEALIYSDRLDEYFAKDDLDTMMDEEKDLIISNEL